MDEKQCQILKRKNVNLSQLYGVGIHGLFETIAALNTEIENEIVLAKIVLNQGEEKQIASDDIFYLANQIRKTRVLQDDVKGFFLSIVK